MPYVIEPAAGLTRSLMCFLVDAYDVDEAPNTKGGVDKRTVLRLDPRLAPVKAAVLPLSKKPELQTVAQNLADDLRFNEWMIDYDDVRCHRSSLPSSGRDRHPAVHHRGLRHPRGPRRDHP